MKKMLKIALSLLLCFAFLTGAGLSAGAISLNLPINTITGTVFVDTDQNGILDVKKLDLPKAGMKVTLYSSLQDAQAGTKAVKSASTSSLGLYSFTGLKRGTYYLSYAKDANVSPVVMGKSAVDADGNQIPGILKVTIGSTDLVLWQDLALRKITNLNLTVFNDANVNGVKDAAETIPGGKTMIILDLLKLKDMIENNSFGEIDILSTLLSTLTGNVDLGDAVFFRTTTEGQKIQFPDVQKGIYVMIRSPFNLTLTNLISDAGRIAALFTLLQSGDPSALINETAGLLDTGDMTTIPTNTYIQLLATWLTKAMDALDSAEVERYLGADIGAQTSMLSGTVRAAANLLDKIPAMRFAAVDRWGSSYDLTDLRITKTSEFLFGLRDFASIAGVVYSDTNADGKKATLELGKAVKVTAYDAGGNVLGSDDSMAVLGSYTIEKMPYDTDIYLAIDSAEPVSPYYDGTLPDALQGLTVIGVYNIPFDLPDPQLKADIGIASVTNLGLQLKSKNDAAKTAVVTVTNKNFASYTVEYSVNDGSASETTISSRGLFSDTKKDITLSGLVSGENIVRIHWKTALYAGPYVELAVTIN
ncbi:MAG TPA: hypothetical protein DEQ02_01110 [Ruminococcaceae bacterium]|nr:hypothetical protein [Oscillospiraceae bacterium]